MSKTFDPEKFGEILHLMIDNALNMLEQAADMNPGLPPEVLMSEILDRSSTAILADLMAASDDNYAEAKEALTGFLGVTRITNQIATNLLDLVEDMKP